MSARKKTHKPLAPAGPIASDADLRKVEYVTRVGIARIKEDDLERGREYSQMVNAGVELVESRLIKGKKFDHPKQRGSFDDLGNLLLEIIIRRLRISNDEAWEELRALANPQHRVVQEVDDEQISYRSGGTDHKPLGRKGFESRMTRYRHHLLKINISK